MRTTGLSTHRLTHSSVITKSKKGFTCLRSNLLANTPPAAAMRPQQLSIGTLVVLDLSDDAKWRQQMASLVLRWAACPRMYLSLQGGVCVCAPRPPCLWEPLSNYAGAGIGPAMAQDPPDMLLALCDVYDCIAAANPRALVVPLPSTSNWRPGRVQGEGEGMQG